MKIIIIKRIIMVCYILCIFSFSCIALDNFTLSGRIDAANDLAKKDKSIAAQGLVVHGIIPDDYFDENLKVGIVRKALLQRRWTNDEINKFRYQFMPARLLPEQIHEHAEGLFRSMFRTCEELEDCFWENGFLQSMKLMADCIEMAINEIDENSYYLLEEEMFDYMHSGGFPQIISEIEDKCKARPQYLDERDYIILKSMRNL